MSRYEPLTRFLEPRVDGEIPLTFAEVERILGRSLPPSARLHQAWWANSESHSQAESWMRAGRRTERLDISGERVVFVQAGRPTASARSPSPNPAPAWPPPDVTVPGESLTGAGWRVVQDHANRHGVSVGAAAAAILNAAGVEARRKLIDEIAANAPKMPPGSNSADLIREDRDAR